jgi:hypothetical protein
MTRWKLTTWFTSAAAVVALTACGSVPTDPGAAADEPTEAQPVDDDEPTEPPVEEPEPPVTEPEPAEPEPRGDDRDRYGPLPPEDHPDTQIERPQPVDPPVCDTASPAPVPC